MIELVNKFKNFLEKRKFKKIGNVSSNLLFEIEQPFNDLYNFGLISSETPDSGIKRRARFYNLVNIYKSVNHLEGAIIECGCWKGLSSFLLCKYIKKYIPDFIGSGYHIFDSFEGLSNPEHEDLITTKLIDLFGNRKNTFFKKGGAYSASIDHVQKVLSEFPIIKYHKGWLPKSLDEVDIQKIKFLHIDLDLYEPIYGTLKFFYPKIVKGGVIVCDDYGSLYWPGAKKAVESFAAENLIEFISLSSGQALIIKK